jgi:hypothetical protein
VAGGLRREQRLDEREEVGGDSLGGAHFVAVSVKALDGRPERTSRKNVVHGCGLFEVAQTALLKVLFGRGVAALRFFGDEHLRLNSGHTQIDHEVFVGETVNGVLEMLKPSDKFVAPMGRYTRRLVSEIGRDVAVGEDYRALFEGAAQLLLGFEAIACIEKCGEVRIDRIQRAKVTVEELPNHAAEPGVVMGKTRRVDLQAARGQSFFKQVELGALAAPVDAFDSDEFARGCEHVAKQFNQRRAGPQRAAWYLWGEDRKCEVRK